MSRWAERFTALSRSHDKSDNSDKRSSDDPGGPSVANCQNCRDKRSADQTTPKPAEILDPAEGVGPSVTIVAFVKETDGEGGTQPRAAEQFSPTVPTIADKRPGDIPASMGGRLRRALPRCRRRPASRPSDGSGSSTRRASFSTAGPARRSAAAGPISTCSAAITIAPAARFDCMGLVLLLDRREVVAIDERARIS